MAASMLHIDDDGSFVDDSNIPDQRWRPQKACFTAAEEAAAASLHDRDGGGSSPADVVAFTSAVKDFDETLSDCFKDVRVRADTVDPASSIAEDSLLERDE